MANQDSACCTHILLRLDKRISTRGVFCRPAEDADVAVHDCELAAVPPTYPLNAYPIGDVGGVLTTRLSLLKFQFRKHFLRLPKAGSAVKSLQATSAASPV